MTERCVCGKRIEVADARCEDETLCHECADALEDEESARIALALRVLALFNDDAVAKEIAETCHDEDHDDRWCPTCANRDDGIGDYRHEVLRRAKEEKP